VLIIAFVSLVIIAAFTVFNNNFKSFVTQLGGDL
jgi:Flp pilus assembly pilin Flp